MKAPNKTPILETNKLCYQKGETVILHHVSLTINRGEIVSIIGPNGAGKSSLVKLLVGLLSPSSGVIKQAADIRLAYMPQRLVVSELMPITVADFIATADASTDLVTSWYQRLNLQSLKSTPVQKLSGGEWQRVLLMRLLLRQPNCLVLDEPGQGVDVAGLGALYRLLMEVRDETNCSVILVSHDLHYVMQKTDQVYCLNKHICCQGVPTHLAQDPAFLALYQHHHDHHHDLFGECKSNKGCDV